jgi:hypothetical protein
MKIWWFLLNLRNFSQIYTTKIEFSQFFWKIENICLKKIIEYNVLTSF